MIWYLPVLIRVTELTFNELLIVAGFTPLKFTQAVQSAGLEDCTALVIRESSPAATVPVVVPTLRVAEFPKPTFKKMQLSRQAGIIPAFAWGKTDAGWLCARINK